jgi:hypothetical protein
MGAHRMSRMDFRETPTDLGGPSYTDPREPAAEAPPAPDTAGSTDVENSEITGVLPRRIRQKSLAPQLRRSRSQLDAADTDDDFEEPDPEFSRDLMSSLQAGWARGRGTDDETTRFDT